MKNIITKYVSMAEASKDLPLLVMRLILAYGFYTPAMNKWADINAIADWFKGLGFPAPHLQAYLAATTEIAGVFLLILGLGTRFIVIPLMIVMLVAIKTVHWENGFNASENGYEIPLYYLIMLFTLFSFGSGKISGDFVIAKIRNKNK
jgi:putative oxidoreductase